jgi:hypothetical protein
MKKNIADFHVLVVFIGKSKKRDLSDKKISFVTRRCRLHNFCEAYSLPLKARKLKFWLLKSLGPT